MRRPPARGSDALLILIRRFTSCVVVLASYPNVVVGVDVPVPAFQFPLTHCRFAGRACARRRALGKILRLEAATAPISGFVDP